MLRLTKSQLTYLAGLIDGRGTVGKVKVGIYTYPVVRMSVTEPRWNLLDKLKEQLGGSISARDTEGYRRYWQLQGKRVLVFLAKIQPYVKSDKRKQEIKELLK